jgi:hypothetical protein
VQAVEVVDGLDAALVRLGDGFDFRRSALVERMRAPALAAALTHDPTSVPSDTAGSAEIQVATPTVVRVATDGPTPALLVLADLDYPGWRVRVDGRDSELAAVDGVLRGVLVPAGAHEVEFRYRPASWLAGAAVSVAALALLLPLVRRSARAHAKLRPAFRR